MNVYVMLMNLLQIREVAVAVIENKKIAEQCKNILGKVSVEDMRSSQRKEVIFVEQVYSVIQQMSIYYFKNSLQRKRIMDDHQLMR